MQPLHLSTFHQSSVCTLYTHISLTHNYYESLVLLPVKAPCLAAVCHSITSHSRMSGLSSLPWYRGKPWTLKQFCTPQAKATSSRSSKRETLPTHIAFSTPLLAAIFKGRNAA